MTKRNQPAANPDGDKLVMLVSADWSERFLPYLGIEIAKEHQAAFRSAARTAVKDLIAGKESYFYVDFTAARIANTRNTFLSEARRKVPASFVAAVDARFDAVLAPSKEEETTISILMDAAWSLAKGEVFLFPNRPRVSVETLRATAESWQLCEEWYGHLFPDADAACWESTTDWDGYLRTLSDLPSFLADYLCATVQIVGRLPLYWSLLTRQVEAADFRRLNVWFREAAALHAQPGLTLSFPSYMGVPSQ